MDSLIGTGVAVVTPFDEQQQVDLPALRRIIRHLIAGKVEYLVALGTTGESVTLSPTESDLVVQTFMEEAAGKVPVVVGVGGNNTASLCEKVAHFTRKFAPAAILSVSPYYNKPTQEGLYQHYKAVAGATHLPVILYNVPGRTSMNLQADTTLRLANDVANIVAIKEASGNFEQCMKLIENRPPGFLVISGDDFLTLPLVALGFDGVISVIANAFPGDFSEMVRLGRLDRTDDARQIHYQLLPLMHLAFEEGNPAGIKAIMEAQGLCNRRVRLPLIEASEELKANIMKEIVPA
ncbi:MAG: 4-hydroxy-tetrahydrodipicolinate synthase [Bacteroidota bacterium]